MKKLFIMICIFFGAFQASAGEKVTYNIEDVEVILACDAVQAQVRNWYVLGRVNYGEPQLFFNSQGRLTADTQQRSTIDDGRLFEVQSGFLTYLFNKTVKGSYKLLITNKNGQKVDLLPCRDYLN